MSDSSYLQDDAGAERVPFVSRSEPVARPLGLDPYGRPLPSLRDTGVRLLLAFVLLLQGMAWWMLEGYQLADSVEYMERALSFVRGEEMIDSHAIRSFGFSSLLVPFFALWQLLGIEDMRPLVEIFRGLQVALGLLLVWRCTRLGAYLGGRQVGLVAGFLCGVNPIFLQYTVSPLSGIAAALFVALALECLMERGSGRRALAGGLWLGMAFLMAFQSILVIAPVVFFVFLRDRFKHFRTTAGVVAGVAVAVAIQLALDKLIYDAWGASLRRYLIENGLYTFVRMLHDTGIPPLKSAAHSIYQWANDLQGRVTPDDAATREVRNIQSKLWYFENLHRMVVWPFLAFGALGLLRAWKQMSWRSSLLLFVLAANVFGMTFKGAKSYRLWLPLLPMIAPLCAWGWGLLAGAGVPRAGWWRKALTSAMLVAGLLLGVRALLDLNTRRFGVYWEAMAIINAEVDRDWERFEAAWEPREKLSWEAPSRVETSPKVRVSSAYHWAMYLRESPRVNLVKLPHHLDAWAAYSEEQREKDRETLESLDWFVTHIPVLTQHPDLFEIVNGHFEVHSALFHGEVFAGLGPVFLLKRRTGEPGARTFFDELPAEELPRDLLGRETRFHVPESDANLTFHGFRYEPLAGRDYGWISYFWESTGGLANDVEFIDRITTPDETRSWQNNHRGAYGVRPATTWRPGTVLRESYLVVPSQEPYRPGSLKNYIGGSYRRGDLIPVRLWFECVEAAPPHRRFEPAADAPLVRSADGLTQVGAFFLPVHPDARAADDGRPLP